MRVLSTGGGGPSAVADLHEVGGAWKYGALNGDDGRYGYRLRGGMDLVYLSLLAR